MNFHIITLFPQSFDSYLKESIISRAIEKKVINIKFYNPRDFAEKKFKRIDNKSYGGGPGMVIEALPVIKAIEKAKGRKKKVKIIFLSPGGSVFDRVYARKIAMGYKDVIIICGRYEGLDARIRKIFKTDEVSIGNFTLTGGELAALVMLDVVSRYIPRVLGNEDSIEETRVSSKEVYTRPEVLEYKGKKYSVPKVLLSGNHKKIDEWKRGKNSGNVA